MKTLAVRIPVQEKRSAADRVAATALHGTGPINLLRWCLVFGTSDRSAVFVFQVLGMQRGGRQENLVRKISSPKRNDS